MGKSNFDVLDANELQVGGAPVVNDAFTQAANVPALTEGGGGIGGSNDGDIPSLTPTVGANIGVFTDPPTAGEMAALRTFVNALKADHAAVVAGLRETADKLNDEIAALKAGQIQASS